MPGLDDVETAQTIMEGLQIYYNLRPYRALDGKTPPQEAKVVVETEKVN